MKRSHRFLTRVDTVWGPALLWQYYHKQRRAGIILPKGTKYAVSPYKGVRMIIESDGESPIFCSSDKII